VKRRLQRRSHEHRADGALLSKRTRREVPAPLRRSTLELISLSS
jgi:hypothetical protein